uniref:Uncharacterized protein n=1 Tax=Anguilla anguilla TaxID=7936 RepID=A0A0E9TZ54_ANGAN
MWQKLNNLQLTLGRKMRKNYRHSPTHTTNNLFILAIPLYGQSLSKIHAVHSSLKLGVNFQPCF